MAHTIIWSLQARDDLQEIVTFIAADIPTIAESFGFRLMSKVANAQIWHGARGESVMPTRLEF